MSHEPVSKTKAIKALKKAGYSEVAKLLDNWRDKNGNNNGWDGWFRGSFKHLIHVVWPH